MEKKSVFSNIIVVCGCAFICCFLWGSAFPCIKIGYNLFDIATNDSASQILFAGIRFLLAGIMAIIIGSIIKRKILIPKQKSLLLVCKLSSMQTIGQYVLFYIGLAHTSGVRASIVEGTNVFVAIIVAALIFKQESITGRKIIGSLLGFVGVILVSISGGSTGSGSFLLGDLLVFLSTICYAVSSVLLKRYAEHEDTFVLSGYQFVIGGIVMIALGLILGGRITYVDNSGILMLIYLAFISSAAYSLWGILLKNNSVSQVAVFGFMNPVIGVILSAILLREGKSLTVISILSLILICAGIYIVNKEKED